MLYPVSMASVARRVRRLALVGRSMAGAARARGSVVLVSRTARLPVDGEFSVTSSETFLDGILIGFTANLSTVLPARLRKGLIS